MLRRSAMLVVASLVLFARLPAEVIFQDNFDAQNGGNYGLGITTLTGWIVTGNVDLKGAGLNMTAHDFYPGNGLYLDLDGSNTGGPIGSNATIETEMVFGPDVYQLTFFLGVNPDIWFQGCTTCGLDNTLTVAIGSFTRTYNATAAGQQITEVFTTTGGALSFANGGPIDATGSILDNVVLSTVPEPATAALTAGALLAFTILVRRRRA